ncbi:PKD domain-containing protein [Microbacterium sp. AGC62]
MITATANQSAHEQRPNDGGSNPDAADRRSAAEKPKPCTTDPVRQASCNFTAERVTNDEGRPLTITDVAQFAPAPVTTAGEPGNVGIAGMPTNFVAAAAVHTRAGTLFDRPISVRFTPVRFRFAFGDGTAATSNTGGRSWASLGQAQFTPTPTSHSYRDRGTYSAHVTVHYTAEVDIGGGWFPIDGELSIDGPARQIRVYEAETALVARTCAEQPGAPGC